MAKVAFVDRRGTGKKLCLSVSAPLFEAMSRVASQEQMPLSAVAREAFRDWLGRYNEFAAPGSATALVEDGAARS